MVFAHASPVPVPSAATAAVSTGSVNDHSEQDPPYSSGSPSEQYYYGKKIYLNFHRLGFFGDLKESQRSALQRFILEICYFCKEK